MLAIKVNNEFLDLPADTGMELSRNNPFLSDDIQGEFSMGLTLRYSEKNYRLLQYIGNFYKKNTKYTVDAQIFDGGLFRYAGKLVINQHQTNMNDVESTVWTGFFTIGSSSFLQDIQDVLLQDVNLGGDRSFAWEGYVKTGTGFWAHIHNARVPNAFDYTFYPISNVGWYPNTQTVWMNKLTDNGTNDFEDNPDQHIYLGSGSPISLCPCIYLSFLLKKIFENFGWRIDGEILNDTGFKKITIPTFQAIKWVDITREWIGGTWVFSPYATITFNLSDHLPPDLTIGSFLVSIKNRFGWFFDFDSNTKTVYLRANKALIGGAVKDWTKYVQANYPAEYQDPEKVFSLINNIDTSDDLPVTKNVDEADLIRADSFASLPAAGAALDGKIAFALFENNFYVCQSDTTAAAYVWQFYAHNVGDYVVANADSTIESDISTMPSDRFTIRSGVDILAPVCNLQGNFFKSSAGQQPWGIRFLFYHGMFADTGGVLYPYASCHNLAISGTPSGEWSLPYRHQAGDVNDGVYDYWWKAWLQLLSVQDFRTFTLALPITELKKFSFSDIIFINNVFFIVQSAKEVLPYRGLIEMKMKRIY